MISEVYKSNIEMEINVTIGHRRFYLQVEKNANIIAQIDKFLQANHLNSKYQGPILQMVRQQLQNKQNKINRHTTEQQEIQKIKSQIEQKKNKAHQTAQMPHKVKMTEKSQGRSKDKGEAIKIKQNNDHKENSHNNQNISTKQMKESQIKKDKCVNVYEKWKKKQKEKDQNKNTKKEIKQATMNQRQQNSTKKGMKKNESHPPQYFYQKGIGFEKQKQIHREELFQKQYPFTSKNISLTPKQKNEVHERLYTEYKIKQSQKIASKVKQIEKEQEKSMNSRMKCDKYKERVRSRDEKVDKAISVLLKNCIIENPNKIRKVSKSPFRKTGF